MKEDKVGDVIDFRGHIYSPVKEQGVVGLFISILKDLNMKIEQLRQEFPDCVIHRYNGKEWIREYVEFELYSKNFKVHKHDPTKCDLLVCWEHNWEECPIEVLELKL